MVREPIIDFMSNIDHAIVQFERDCASGVTIYEVSPDGFKYKVDSRKPSSKRERQAGMRLALYGEELPINATNAARRGYQSESKILC